MATAIAVAGVAVSAASAHTQRQASRQEADAARGAQAERKKIADVRAVRERRNVIREIRIKRAQAVQAGVNSGAGAQSSGIAGGISSITKQGESNLSFLDKVRSSNDAIGIFQQQGLEARQAGQVAQARGALGQTIFGSGGLAERGLAAFNKPKEKS